MKDALHVRNAPQPPIRRVSANPGQTARDIASGAVAMAQEDPEYAVAAIGLELMTGKVKPVGGGNLRSPKTIKFSQNTIGTTFGDGRSLSATVAELAAEADRGAVAARTHGLTKLVVLVALRV